MVLAKADYQFEIKLLSYRNPRGLDNQQRCCEPEAMVGGNCLPQETCDTVFNIRLLNFDQLSRQLGESVGLGTFENMDTITFPECGPMLGGMPLTVMFSQSEFSLGVSDSCSIKVTYVTNAS